jgi:large subunit ribosomal protein L32e
MAAKRKKKPTFNVLNAGFKVRVKSRWRKPRGTDNKKRVRYKSMGAHPRIGYKNAPGIRCMHPSGKMEALVHNETELRAQKGVAIRFAKAVGKRKREHLAKVAAELKLDVLN